MNIKKIFSLFLSCIILSLMLITSDMNILGANDTPEKTDEGSGLSLTSKAAVLMEASTGTVIYKNNADERLSPASITKIMTLILIFDAISDGKISLQDEVITSEYAKSMGGSQVFLETGEKQTVETLIKCIVVASGNDASVAMAEHISGSEDEFVANMNRRAKTLGMENTHFVDCCGLTESAKHYSSAYDVALMSRELITKYPEIFDYSSIWMENITHVTEKGSSEFGLTNTNKLLKQYEWTTGLKTGSTSIAKYCLSATAKKDNIDLIAVIMAAPDYKARFKEAITLLNFGYANCKLFRSINDEMYEISITGGTVEKVKCRYDKEFSYLSTTGENVDGITKNLILPESVTAPISSGDIIGYEEYYLGDKKIGEVNILATEDADKAGFIQYLRKTVSCLLGI